VMNQFEFIDPADTLGRRMKDAGCDADHPHVPAVRGSVEADAGSAAASRPALRRHGDLSGPAGLCGAAGKRQHAGARGDSVGQRRLLGHGHREGGSARPRHDGGAPGCHPAGQRRGSRGREGRGLRDRRSWISRTPAGRSGRVPHDAGGGYHRPLPGGVRARRWPRCRG
jgi:hypothetical protein